MNPEDIACCVVCQLTFSTHEELAGHACQQIKKEPKESSEDNKVQFEEQEDFKYEINPPDFSENEENQENQEIKEEEKKKVKKTKVKKPKKKKPKVQVKEERSEFEYWNPLNPLDPNNLELSEDFIFFILRQVDVLCENIRNGDPDQERTLEVNRDLNKAVSCYRSKLDLQNQHFINDPIDQDYYDNDDMDYEQEPKVFDNGSKMTEEKKRRKKERRTEALNDQMFEFVKNQCGRHSVSAMGIFLNMPKSTLHERIKKAGINFVEREEECHFCELKKNNEKDQNFSSDHLFPFLRFNTDKDRFVCSVCNFHGRKRSTVLAHVKVAHRRELNAAVTNNTKLEEIPDCGKGMCKKLYGENEGRKFWCIKCAEDWKLYQLEHPASEFQKPKYVPKQKVCPECGISVFNLGYHLSTHKGEKQICPHCAREVRSLQVHIKNVHTKLPCSQCGKLVGSGVMNRHMASAHTPNDQKKYQCDICGKGFASKNNFQEHKYVHTGEKPYKCKYCSACFASKGTHAMHEKGHLGHRRNSSKV